MTKHVLVGNLADLAEQGHFDVIFHGTNCMHAMGSGVAQHLVEKFPALIEADKKTPRGDSNKIGTYSHVVVYPQGEHKPLVILNGYTQHYYGRFHYKTGLFNYPAFRQLCERIIQRLGGRGLRFGYPLIAGDRGNADPEKILAIIDEIFKDENHTLVLFREPGRRQNPLITQLIAQAQTHSC